MFTSRLISATDKQHKKKDIIAYADNKDLDHTACEFDQTAHAV